MDFCILSRDLEPQYEKFLYGHKQALFYYSLRFRSFLERLLDCDSLYWLAMDGGEVTGVLPLMIKNGPYGNVVNSLPFYGSYGGVLARDNQTCSNLYSIYSDFLKDRNIASSTIIVNPLLETDSFLIPHHVTDDRICQITPLDNIDEFGELFFAKIDSAVRRNVRKARKLQVEVSVDNNAIKFLEEAHLENMADIGGLAKPSLFFELLPKFFRQEIDYKIYTAIIDGEMIAALLLFFYAGTVEYYIPVTKSGYRNKQPMSAILFQAINDAAHDGYKRWNWGGTWVKNQEGVYCFKKKWDARDFYYKYYTYIGNKKIMQATSYELLNEYRNFYTIPFSLLSK